MLQTPSIYKSGITTHPEAQNAMAGHLRPTEGHTTTYCVFGIVSTLYMCVVVVVLWVGAGRAS